MSEKTDFCYYEATTLPSAGGRPAVSRASTAVAAGVVDGILPVAVKVAAGAGDRCVAPAASRPKRRAMIRNNNNNDDDDDEDTLNVPSIQWSSAGVSVSELATNYRTQFPLLAKVTDDTVDFARGQV